MKTSHLTSTDTDTSNHASGNGGPNVHYYFEISVHRKYVHVQSRVGKERETNLLYFSSL